MRTNQDFLEVIRASFKEYLNAGNSRSTKKLKPLHGGIAEDIREIFGSKYTVKSQDNAGGKEGTIKGNYYPKKVDITVCENGNPVAGYAIKFVMRNYSQNSVNYFENMLGETANIRSNGIPYFHVFIIFDQVPHYGNNGTFKGYDVLTKHNLDKYIALSKDDPSKYISAPDKMLFVILRLKEKSSSHAFADETDYANYYLSVINDADLISYSDKFKGEFGNGVILNDYATFIDATHSIAMKKQTVGVP